MCDWPCRCVIHLTQEKVRCWNTFRDWNCLIFWLVVHGCPNELKEAVLIYSTIWRPLLDSRVDCAYSLIGAVT